MTAAAATAPFVALEGVRFSYGDGAWSLRVDALDLSPGEHMACVGPSGSGKTTLVNLAAGILVPTAGTVRLGGEVLSSMGDADRRARRIGSVGMMFQQLELLDYLDVLDNVLLPYHVGPALRLDDAARERARSLCAATGLGDLVRRRPARLSQGERQRVALCRALVTEPRLVLCDEPTSSLDPDTADTVLDLLFAQTRARGASLLMVTHDHGLLPRFDRVVAIERCPGEGVVREVGA